MIEEEAGPTAQVPVTEWLEEWRSGSKRAGERVGHHFYADLRRMAAAVRRGERPDLTLDATEIVHEAWLSLTRSEQPRWESRGHFLGIASYLMRQVVTAHARRRRRLKRGGPYAAAARRPVDEEALPSADRIEDELVALERALARLGRADPLGAQVVELRYLGGLTLEETAATLGLGRATVVRKWRSARAFLRVHLVHG